MRVIPSRSVRCFASVALCFAAVLPAAAARAGNNVETTWLPMQEFTLQPGPQNSIHLKLPSDRFGPARQAVFLVSRVLPQTTQPSSGPAFAPAQVLLKIKTGDKLLPPWPLGETTTGYLINLATLAANPGRAEGELWLDIELVAPGPTGVAALGTPDVVPVNTERDGPLDDYATALPAGPARDYFDGLRIHMTGDLDGAAAKYTAAANAGDESIARFARRSLRIVRCQKRPRLPDEDYQAHRRMATYLQTCGFFALAFGESRNIGGFDLNSGDAWYRLGELAERLGWPLNDVTQAFGRAGYAMSVQDPVEWNALVAILAEEDVAFTDAGGQVTTRTVKLSPEQVQAVYDNWFTVEQMVIGASGGLLEIKTHFLYLANSSVQRYTQYPGGLTGPADDLFPIRGSYDSVISVRPGGGNQTVGPDVGPNGAALTDLGPGRDWEVMLHEWSRQFEWALTACEAGPGFPAVPDSDGCGIRPIPNMGAGHRAALRYYMTPAMYRKTLMAAPSERLIATSRPATEPASQPASQASSQAASRPAVKWDFNPEPSGFEYLRRWKVEGPYDVRGPIAADGTPGKHVLDPFPPTVRLGGDAANSAREKIVDSPTDFVDLIRELGPTSGAVARASCWVYSPQDQFAQAWLGHNDGMALWVNGQCVHRGDYYAAARWEDKNLTDMVMAHAILRRGWNRVEGVIEAWPAPREKGWGFSLRFADRRGKPPVGLAYRVTDPPEAERVQPPTPPTAGPYYIWPQVQQAYHEALPQLSNDDLARITGVPGLCVRGAVNALRGYVAIGVPDAPGGGRIRPLPAAWNGDRDADWTLNNVLDWSREDVCAYPYKKLGFDRTLLLLRPEAVRPYLDLLAESTEARSQFGTRAVQDRVLGWVRIPPGSSERTLIVVDASLGDPAKWPVDEEDLLGLPGPTPPKPKKRRVPASWPAIPTATATASAPSGR